jgi:2-hydroxy-3-keto-5-methylthiopentenyl-1-phosphate phosphatase
VPNTALFFDFDNTLTSGDLLDEVIATFSPDERWREWEDAWTHGRISARDCLREQVGALRVTRETLLRHLATARIDPAFPKILAWAKRRGVRITIVSDSFLPLIEHVLHVNGIYGVRVLANELRFCGDRLVPSFPHYDPAFPRSANAKARHVARSEARRIVFAGDGYSDLDAALAAHVVFAKARLASELAARGVPFRPFETLAPVLSFLEASEAARKAIPPPHSAGAVGPLRSSTARAVGEGSVGSPGTGLRPQREERAIPRELARVCTSDGKPKTAA